jgi:LysM repeat protein
MSTMTLHHVTLSHPIPQARPASTMRLTRRGRLVVLVIALGIMLSVGFVLASGSVATERAGTPDPTRVVMVGSGDTLWDIAADLAPAGDTRAMMEEIERLNALDSSMVSVGQELIVPADE